MSKTPEEMAEEFAAINGRYDPLNANCSWGKNAFIGGYKAQKHAHAALEEAEAKIQELRDQLMEESGCRLRLFKDNADAKAAYLEALQDTDSCEHILDMEKMVDVKSCSCSGILNNWISVKDRLPDANQGWVTVYGANWGFRWMVQPGFYDVETKEWLSRFIRGDEEGYCALEAVSHWQELPEPPKEEK
jgi:hypothetical protein